MHDARVTRPFYFLRRVSYARLYAYRLRYCGHPLVRTRKYPWASPFLYVNDLPSSLHYAIPYMFADDTKCAITIDRSLETIPLQSDLVNLSTWSSTWRLATI